MIFNSIDYLIFFPVVLLFYFLLPKRIRYIWLLIASYFFYMCWNAKYAVLILFSTVVTYLGGLLLGKENTENTSKRKFIVAITFTLNLLVLFYFKYFGFATETVVNLFRLFGTDISTPSFDILLPVGISFYTFQALGYIMDVYRNETKAEKDFFMYALFVSFFPQLVAGPIERSKNLLTQLKTDHDFDYEKARYGMLMIAYGLVLKIVIADQIAAVINPVFNSPMDYSGSVLFVAAVLFSFQIYCDFNGYTQIAIGSAKVLGYDLMENFRTPYYAASVTDFWRRWHISLTSWFRDYLYIPLGGNRKGMVRKQINTLIVFLLSGLWHGAAWHFVVWGGVSGLLLIIESAFNIQGINLQEVSGTKKLMGIVQRIFTFITVVGVWIFFRANTLLDSFKIFGKIIGDLRIKEFILGGYHSIFETKSIFFLCFIPLLGLMATDYLKYRGKDIFYLVLNQKFIIRWIIYFVILAIIVYLGAYGLDYEQTQFIYFQF